MNIFPNSIKRILVTGGAGFIGGALVRRLLKDTSVKVFNLDKLTYASDINGITKIISDLNITAERYELLKVDLFDLNATQAAIKLSNPDIVFHLAAESHVDRSISRPLKFLESNIIGTFNLLESLRLHWEGLKGFRKNDFRMIHISTDEVFGSIDADNLFSESTPYDPKSPYSASKASSDHLVKAWNHTYGLPTLITNSSNNFGPWQFPEKLIPVIIKQAISNKPIPIYGDGKNIREWIYVEDHIDALLAVATKGCIGNSYCIGTGHQKTNLEIVDLVCNYLDSYIKTNAPHNRLKTFVKDRPGHDREYGLDSSKIRQQLNWKAKHDFNESLLKTVEWYLENINFLNNI